MATQTSPAQSNVLRSVLPVQLYQGYDTIQNLAKNQVAVQDTGDPVDTGATSSDYIRVATGASSLATSLGIDVSASVSSAFGSVSDKLDYFNSLDKSAYTVSVVIRTYRGTGLNVNSPQMNPAAMPASADTGDIDNFVITYGDSYVSRIILGGEYLAVYQFLSETETDSVSVTNSLRGQGVYSGVKVEASLDTSFKSVTTSTNVAWTFSAKIFGISPIPDYPDSDGAVAYVKTFQAATLNAPAVIDFETEGYEKLPNCSTLFETVASNRVYFDGTGTASGVLASLLQLQEVQSEINNLLSLYKFYGYTENPNIMITNSGLVQADINAVLAKVNAYEAAPSVDVSVPQLTFTSPAKTPSLNVQYANYGPYGGSGGNPFDDVTVGSYLQNLTRISLIRIRSGARVNMLEVTYLDQSGNAVVASHGSNGGGSFQTPYLQLAQGNVINFIEVYSGNRVGQMTIKATDGTQTDGGTDDLGEYAGKDPKSYLWQAKPGEILLGFFGSAGGELNLVGWRTATFQSAIWNPLPASS